MSHYPLPCTTPAADLRHNTTRPPLTARLLQLLGKAKKKRQRDRHAHAGSRKRKPKEPSQKRWTSSDRENDDARSRTTARGIYCT